MISILNFVNVSYRLWLLNHPCISALNLTWQNGRYTKDSNKRWKKPSYNDKEVSLSREYNICKYFCTQHKSIYYIKEILTHMKGKNRQQYSNNRGFQYPTFNNTQKMKIETLDLHSHRPDGPNRHTELFNK